MSPRSSGRPAGGALHRLARAKVNLFLHVGPVGADGYHPVCSLVAFADLGDRLALRPAQKMGFDVRGPFAAALAGEGDNLVPRARDRLLEVVEARAPPACFALTLDKQLPIAAGLGGGSADAAATLAVVAAWLGADAALLAPIARSLGADVAACLASTPVIATGRGDILAPAPRMPVLDVVLANPGAASSTAAVYRAFDDAGAPGGADGPAVPEAFASALEVAAFLRGRRNDLEAPAVALQPLIGETLATLAGEPETLLARMSGSGATCFALCADAPAAAALANRIGKAHAGWWVRACRLGV